MALEVDVILRILITHYPQPNPGIAKRQGISVLEPSEGCLLYPSPLFQPAFQPAATCQGRVQRARAGVYRGLARYAWLRMVRNQVLLCRRTLSGLVGSTE